MTFRGWKYLSLNDDKQNLPMRNWCRCVEMWDLVWCFYSSRFRWLFRKTTPQSLLFNMYLNTCSSMVQFISINISTCNKIENTEYPFFKYEVSECSIHPLASNPDNTLISHGRRSAETEHCTSVGGGRCTVGIPKHYSIESKCWSKNTFWIYIVHYVNKHSE